MESVHLTLEKNYQDKVQFITADVTNGANPTTQSEQEAVQLAQMYNVSSIPAFFLIDKNGNVIDQAIGANSYEFFAAKIESLIEKSK